MTLQSALIVDEARYGRERGAEHIPSLCVGAAPSPCDACTSKSRCMADKLACADFGHYMARGKLVDRDRKPSAERFRAMFG